MSTISIRDRIDYLIGNRCFGDVEPKAGGNKLFLYDGTQQGVVYQEDVERLFALSNTDKIWFRCSDARYTGPHYPVITKTIDTHDINSKGIIGSLEYTRHFGNCFATKKFDSDWKNKKNNLIWRGASTGIGKDKRIFSRLDFVKTFFSTYDVGLSTLANKWGQENKKIFETYKKPLISMKDQLEYKYIPILDGNDKASCLNWILASNSVPIMPKPRFHSWLCEPFLRPNFHYVEVRDDFSDLEQKIKWCIANDEICNGIAQNGKNFMYCNFNTEIERFVERELMKEVDLVYNKLKG